MKARDFLLLLGSAVLLYTALAQADTAPSGVKNSRNLQHYRERIINALETSVLRGQRSRSSADRLRVKATTLRLTALGIEAMTMTPETFARLKKPFRIPTFLRAPLERSEQRRTFGDVEDRFRDRNRR